MSRPVSARPRSIGVKPCTASYDRAGVAHRLRDSLDQLESAGEPLDGWQSDMLARAITCLQTGMYALAVDAAYRACRPYLYRSRDAAIAYSNSPIVTVAELRTELDRVLADSAAKAVVLAELSRQISEPKAWAEMHLLCAIEAIRRGDHKIALNHISILRHGPTLKEFTMEPSRPLNTRERLRRMLDAL